MPETVHHVLVRVDPDRDEAALMVTAEVQARTDGAAVGPGSEGAEEERAERLKRLKPQVFFFVCFCGGFVSNAPCDTCYSCNV